MVTLLYFGRFQDVAQNGAVSLPDDVTDTKALTAWLTSQHPSFEHEWQRPGARMAVNQEIVPDLETRPISDGDEIAFMSALSGG